MKRHANVIAMTAFCGAVCAPSASMATGLGNLTYTQAELEKPVANFGGESANKWPTGPTGSNTILMLRDVLVIMGSNDSGAPPGSFHFYDVKDPRHPKLLKTYDGTPETSHLRELHAMPVAMIDGKDILVAPSTTGLQFFDFTDPMNPSPAGSIALTGVNGGDYDNAAWMLSWEWPYVFAGGTGNGVFIVDATDPAHAVEVPHVATGMLGNFRVGPTYAAGNYLVVANMDQGTTHFSVLDVGNPKSPALLATGTTPASLYSALVVGDRIYGAGTNGDYSFMKWSATAVTQISTAKNGTDRGGYCTLQSGFAICGQSSEGYKKWDLHDEVHPKLVGHGTDPAGVGGDFDFATVAGNLVYLGNDHGSGAALVPHTMAPDSTAPEVAKIYPNDGDTKQPLTTRVTVFFSEDIDLGTVNPTNLIVRKNGGAAIDGVFSKSSFNAISFGAKQPLTANTTYEVVVPAGGLKDLVGNPIAGAATARFSTGPTVEGAIASPDAGGGAAGGPASTPEAGAPLGTGGAGGASAGSPIVGAGGDPSGSGGSMIAAGSSGSAPMAGDAGGCSCSLPRSSARGGGLSLLLAALFGLRQSRGRRRRNGGATAA